MEENVKHAGGRPPIFQNQEDLKKKVEDYFIWIKGEKQTIVLPSGETVEQIREAEPATITGLALFLGFESRQSIYDYSENEQFSYIIKNARLRVECEYEKKLSYSNPGGPIFALKNMGWKDKTEQDMNLKGGVFVNFTPAANCDPMQDESSQH